MKDSMNLVMRNCVICNKKVMCELEDTEHPIC